MPPRLLTGITLLFWGGMTGHPLPGLVAALLLEAKSWTTLRWNFSEKTYIRSWHYSVFCAALISILAWMNGMKTGQLHSLFIWAPLALLPVELAMRYGKREKIPLNTFSYFARKKLQQDLRHGRPVYPRTINTGYPYIAVALLATAMGSRNDLYHLIGFNLIVAVALFFNARQIGFRPFAWIVAILCVFCLNFFSQWGLFKLYDHYRGGTTEDQTSQRFSANQTRTSIGKLGKLKLSPRIFWRMQVHGNKVPKLLRVATYNHYSRSSWKYKSDHDPETSFRDDDGYLTAENISSDEQDIRIFREGDLSPPPTFSAPAHINILGEVDAQIQENPIPMPHFMQAVGGISQLGIETSIESNTLGTIRLANPDYNVIEYQVWTGNHSTTETAPSPTHELAIPPRELAAIRRINQQLGIYQLTTTQQKINRLRQFFSSEFSYSTHLTTSKIGKNQRNTAVGNFLESTRSGHCEYFATATALLLRDAGVPTRYCVGFSVSELDTEHQEWLLRGKHAHAWCRVMIDGQWQDLDLTPPSWIVMEETNTHLWQHKLADWWQRLREDFLIWRTHETNQTRVITIVSAIIILFTLWIIWRLWKSRQSGQHSKHQRYQAPKNTPVTPLNRLEPRLAKVLGPRPPGTPLVRWTSKLTKLDPSMEPLVTKITQQHSKLRFDPNSYDSSKNLALLQSCRELNKKVRKFKSHRRRWQ